MELNNLNYSLHYENWHQDTEESKEQDIKANKEVIRLHNLLPKNKNAKILDAGCGMGRFLLTLADLGFTNLKGVEIDKTQFEIAKKAGLDIEYNDIITYFESDKNLYDAIYCFDILEHIEKEKQIILLNQLYNHLSDNGMIVLRIPNALAPTATLFRYEDFTHTTMYTPVTIDFLCKNSGFKFITIRPEVQETDELQILKKNFADIYRKQFGYKDVILTPNLMVILFKNEELHNIYNKEAPKISNTYLDEENTQVVCKGILFVIRYYINKLMIKITFGKLKKHFKSKFPHEYKFMLLQKK